MANEQKVTRISTDGHFVHSVIRRCAVDRGVASALKKSDNPSTEYMSWDYLATFGINLEFEDSRLPYVTVGAAIARSKPDANGNVSLGKAIAHCYPDGNQSNPAKTRIRRLLACSEMAEVCMILRPLFSLISSRTSHPLDYVRLVGQIRRFPHDPEQVKAQWAQEFYSTSRQKEEAQ